MSTVLVTGGAGFIGSHIVDAMIAAGHHVAVVDNLAHGRRENVHPEAAFYGVDIRNMDDLSSIFAVEHPECILHQAALASVRESLERPNEYAEVNILGGLNLLELARAYGVQKFVYACTGGAAYGEGRGLEPFREDRPPQPLDPYGTSKIAFEYYLHVYRHNFGLDYVSLRYANVYGPRQDPFGEGGVVAIFAQRMAAGLPCTIFGNGEKVRDFVYVGDVARANLLALDRGSGNCNIGTGVRTTINLIFRALAAANPGYNLPPVYEPDKPGEVWVSCLNADRAHDLLGWMPEVTLIEGLQRTAAYFRA